MNLQKEDQDLHDFHKDDVPNIWSLGDEDNGSMLDSDEDELDKPSFLRRFKRRTRKEDEEDDAGEASPPDRADEPAEEDGNSEDADEDPAEDEKPKSKKK
jgi:hypothetical protein